MQPQSYIRQYETGTKARARPRHRNWKGSNAGATRSTDLDPQRVQPETPVSNVPSTATTGSGRIATTFEAKHERTPAQQSRPRKVKPGRQIGPCVARQQSWEPATGQARGRQHQARRGAQLEADRNLSLAHKCQAATNVRRDT